MKKGNIGLKWVKILISEPAITSSKLIIETNCEICSDLTIKTAESRPWHRSYLFIGDFEHNLHLILVFLLLTLNI